MDRATSIYLIQNFVEQRELTTRAIDMVRKKTEKSQAAMCEYHKQQHHQECLKTLIKKWFYWRFFFFVWVQLWILM